MPIPVDISFHHCQGSTAIEDAIRDHVARLEEIYSRLTACRVRIDQSNDNPAHSIPPVVRIEIGIPGRGDVVVTHDRLQRKFQRPDIRNAINEAFRVAERQLSGLKDEATDHKAEAGHESANELSGQVSDMPFGEDYGFLLTRDGGQLYFHRNSVLSGDFDALRRGSAVSYVEEMGDTGPIATKVRVKETRSWE
jgi:cold shock CspA family protein/ribosome-associated translation inhibitor RaiA